MASSKRKKRLYWVNQMEGKTQTTVQKTDTVNNFSNVYLQIGEHWVRRLDPPVIDAIEFAPFLYHTTPDHENVRFLGEGEWFLRKTLRG